jgi:hypothetical protein
VESGLTLLPKKPVSQLVDDLRNRPEILAECRAVIAAETPTPIEQFAVIVERLALHYPENKLSVQERKAAMQDWRRLLGHLPADILGAAADAYLMSPARFFPTPGQLNELAEPMWRYREALVKRANDVLALVRDERPYQKD